jgi:hypothetical protein
MVKLTESEQIILDASIEELSLEQRDMRRKIKQRISQEKYRDKLRTGDKEKFMENQRNQKTLSRINIQNTLLNDAKEKNPNKKNIIDRQLAELDKKKSEITKPTKKIIQKPPQITTDKKTLPIWKKKVLESGAVKGSAEYKGIRGYSDKQLKLDLANINTILQRILKRKLNDVEIQLITKIYNAEDLTKNEIETLFSKDNLSIFKKESIQTVIDELYKSGLKENSIKTKLRPIQNIMARIEEDEYDDVYQILANITSNVNNRYIARRDENQVEAKDIDKARALSTWSLDKNKIKDQKELINDSPLDAEEKAIASLYYLMPPRRLEYATMKISDETDESVLKNASENYLILKNDKPDKFVFGNFKTNEKGGLVKKQLFGTQIFNVNNDVKQYLTKHIKENKLSIGDNLFKDNTEAKLGVKLEYINFKIFNIKGIGVIMIRQAGATYNQNTPRRSNKLKKDFATQMAHDFIMNTQYAKILEDDQDLNKDDDEDEVYIPKQTKNPRQAQVKKGKKIPTTPTVIPKLVNLDLTYKPRNRKKPDRFKA